MSRYLIRRIESNPAITLRTKTEIVALEAAIIWRRCAGGTIEAGLTETHDIRHVFTMTGAVPNTLVAPGVCRRRRARIYQDGARSIADDLAAAHWPLPRAPHLLETSLPACSRSRRARWQHEARGVGCRRGGHRGLVRTSGARGMTGAAELELLHEFPLHASCSQRGGVSN